MLYYTLATFSKTADMIIGVAGPYSADTEAQRQANLNRLNEAAAILLAKGHIPLIGINAALPVVDAAHVPDRYQAIMDISMAVIDKCEALLLIAESRGANMERDHILAKGLPVYYSIEEIPDRKI
ncbi:hypothetical protein CAP35_00080 [Chitinophagaceae bacterium IBVUCB1]|nr:hypothetical protein CAP35_00080 [Chitinophagaceae bacterium IBVUCB1]